MTGLEDLHGGHGMAENEANGIGFGLMEEDQQMMAGDDDLLGVSTDPSMFFAEFPSLPDFTCMSSSSSSSSPPQPGEFVAHTCSTSSATSSSASSWVVHKSEAESYHHLKGQQRACLEAHAAASAALHSTASMEVGHQNQHQPVDGQQVCMVENFGYMDLLDSNDLFDLSMILNSETPVDGGSEQDQHITPQEFLQQNLQPAQGDGRSPSMKNNTTRAGAGEVGGGRVPHDDMSQVFFEWLKSNKGAVSAEDLRKVKIKRATIESAARRLGGGREAMKQLLKLILEWVQSNVLKKRTRGGAPEGSQQLQNNSQEPPCVTNNNMNNLNPVQPDTTLCFPQSQWTLQTPYALDSPATMAPAQPVFQPGGCVGNDPYSNGNSYQQSADYQMLDSGQIWAGSQFGHAPNYNSFPDNNFGPVTPPTPQAYSGFGSQYPFGQYGENGLVRLGSSATKEARKKRMARQRRMMSYHRQHNQQNQQPNLPSEQRGLLGVDNCTAIPPQASQGNWIYWQPVPGGGATAPGIIPMDTAQARQATQSYQWQVISPERRQGWKSEKNLKFLLQKVLKQSDVGSLGRIVLPKKEAEAHLPELDARDGISIAMEDIGTSRVWNMRYRFWPNNKSRMYLLENTSEFVRANGLQEGDFIVIYSDLKCGKYMIRGVKVRPQVKTENKRAGKAQKTLNVSSPAGELSSAITQNQ